jgi:hypothetical protein
MECNFGYGRISKKDRTSIKRPSSYDWDGNLCRKMDHQLDQIYNHNYFKAIKKGSFVDHHFWMNVMFVMLFVALEYKASVKFYNLHAKRFGITTSITHYLPDGKVQTVVNRFGGTLLPIDSFEAIWYVLVITSTLRYTRQTLFG